MRIPCGPTAPGGPATAGGSATAGGQAIDLVDETFIAAAPTAVAAAFAQPGAAEQYWPDLVLEVYRDRGAEGLRWTVRGALIGTMEVWLEPVLDGTVVHYFLRAHLPERGDRPRRLLGRKPAGGEPHAQYQRRARAAKAIALELKRLLEQGRQPGEPPRH